MLPADRPNDVDAKQYQPLDEVTKFIHGLVVGAAPTVMLHHVVEFADGCQGALKVPVLQARQHRREDHVEVTGAPMDLLESAADDHRTLGDACDNGGHVIRYHAVHAAHDHRVEHQRVETRPRLRPRPRRRRRSLPDCVRMTAVETGHVEQHSAVFQHDRVGRSRWKKECRELSFTAVSEAQFH